MTEVAEQGDEVTLWFSDAPERPLIVPSRTALVIGMALQRASSIAGRRGVSVPEQRTMARSREEQAQRIAHAVEIERRRRGGTPR